MIGSTNIRVGAGESIDNITLMKAVDTPNSFLLGKILASDTQYQNVNNLVNTYGVITYGLQNGVPTFPDFPIEIITCPNCNGAGTITSTCEICSGSGSVTEQPVDTDPDTGNPLYACPKCNSYGIIPCTSCNGLGVLTTPTGDVLQVGTDLRGKTLLVSHASYVDPGVIGSDSSGDAIMVNDDYFWSVVEDSYTQELGVDYDEDHDPIYVFVFPDDQSYTVTSLTLNGHDSAYSIVTTTPCSAGCNYGGFDCELCEGRGVTDNVLYTECPVCNGTGTINNE